MTDPVMTTVLHSGPITETFLPILHFKIFTIPIIYQKYSKHSNYSNTQKYSKCQKYAKYTKYTGIFKNTQRYQEILVITTGGHKITFYTST